MKGDPRRSKDLIRRAMLIEAGCGDAGWGKWECNDFWAWWCARDNTAGCVILAEQERGFSPPRAE